MHTGLCAWTGWDGVVFDGQSSIRQNIHGAESDSATLSLRLIFQADCVLMWCWWKCIALTLIEIVCRLPVNVNLSHLFFIRLLWQNQTAPSSSSSPQEKTLWCFRRQHRRVSQSLSQLLSHLIRPLLRLLLYLSLPPASPSPSVSPCLCPLSAAVSHHLLAALFQAGHCLISECLRSVLPTLCSSIILLANP